MLKLKTETRNSGSQRQVGVVPAVVYGPKMETTPIAVSQAELKRVWKSAGESTVITLEGAIGGIDVLIHDIQRDPVKSDIIHVDFYAVDKDKKIAVDIQLEFIGTAPAVKEQGGVFMKIAHELSIEALPKDLPHAIEVDISSLKNLEDQITAGDIKLPTGVTLNVDPEEVIAIVAAAKEETDEAPVTIDMSAIGLSEKKGKKEEEGEVAE